MLIGELAVVRLSLESKDRHATFFAYPRSESIFYFCMFFL